MAATASPVMSAIRPSADTQSRMSIQSLLNPDDRTPALSCSPRTASSDDDRSRGRTCSSSPDLSRGPARSSRSSSWSDGRTASARVCKRERREFRPSYEREEEYFIWYHRIDLGLDWTDVKNAYNAQFPDRQRAGFQGIQCKYYRCCESHGLPHVRERNRSPYPDGSFHIRRWIPGLWYPWMRPERDDGEPGAPAPASATAVDGRGVAGPDTHAPRSRRRALLSPPVRVRHHR